MDHPFHFEPWEVPEELEPLRQEVRAFAAEATQASGGWERAHSWTGFDREFTRRVAARGWIGMTWPRRYGGGQRSALERYVVVEELLAAGCPVGAHWVADRQSGPLILRVGTEAQKERFLPAIARGEAAFCIGLSEPGAGSDLASLRSRAQRVDGGWQLNGRKIWTTYARESDFMIGLFRSGAAELRQGGLSQFLIDLRSPGIEIRPIADLTGESHFNEITFDQVFVPEDMLLGQEGEGWAQVTAELAFERSGPDRYLSSFPLLPPLLDAVNRSSPDRLARQRIGEAVAELMVLREMSLSVLGQLDAGETPLQEAALTKLLGTAFEQGLPDLARELVDAEPAFEPQDRLGGALAFLMQTVPAFSLRGGTNEIMRGIVARGLGLR